VNQLIQRSVILSLYLPLYIKADRHDWPLNMRRILPNTSKRWKCEEESQKCEEVEMGGGGLAMRSERSRGVEVGRVGMEVGLGEWTWESDVGSDIRSEIKLPKI
jgi:hypothetical protein